MKKIFFFLLPMLVLMGISCIPQKDEDQTEIHQEAQTTRVSDYDSVAVDKRFKAGIKRVENYLLTHKSLYASDIAILVDMHLSSKYYRLFVVDLNSDKILSRGMVAHGSGSEIEGSDSLQFSNVPNSYMTSLGLYKIGTAYQGSFGRSFKLHGLEKTNDKALARAIVLHRYMCVPDEEQAYPICNSLGCIMLSENYFETLAKYIDARKKPIMMNVYY